MDNFTDAELRELTGGCTELSCIYHGEINRELRRRRGTRCPVCAEYGGFHVDEWRGMQYPGHAHARAHIPRHLVRHPKEKR